MCGGEGTFGAWVVQGAARDVKGFMDMWKRPCEVRLAEELLCTCVMLLAAERSGLDARLATRLGTREESLLVRWLSG